MRYAVKLGEVHLQSDELITDEQRKAAIEQLKRLGYRFVMDSGLAATLRVDRH